jgi:hypothetical protein
VAIFSISLFDKVGDHPRAGFDLCVDASELGIRPGKRPPEQITVEMSDGSTDQFDLCAQVYRSSAALRGAGEFEYWSYWNESPRPAVNLKIFND